MTQFAKGGDGVVLGVQAGLEYQEETLKLEPGDLLFLYTDGLTEAFNNDREQFGEERLESFIYENSAENLEDLCNATLRRIKDFTNGADASDDMTCLAIRRSVA